MIFFSKNIRLFDTCVISQKNVIGTSRFIAYMNCAVMIRGIVKRFEVSNDRRRLTPRR